MSERTYIVTASAHLNAPPSQIYRTIANYRNGHPRILPKQFSRLEVEQGGIGAGTVITFRVTVFGQTQHFKAAVSEPQPGRVLVETNSQPHKSISTFTVDPGPGGHGAQVTIATEMPDRGGPFGAIERMITTRVMQSMYRAELTLLERVANEVLSP